MQRRRVRGRLLAAAGAVAAALVVLAVVHSLWWLAPLPWVAAVALAAVLGLTSDQVLAVVDTDEGDAGRGPAGVVPFG